MKGRALECHLGINFEDTESRRSSQTYYVCEDTDDEPLVVHESRLKPDDYIFMSGSYAECRDFVKSWHGDDIA